MSDSPNDDQTATGSELPAGEAAEGGEQSAPSAGSGTGDTDPEAVAQGADNDCVEPPSAVQLKANQLSSVEELIRFAYQQNGKRLSLPAAVVGKIAAEAQLDDDASEPLVTLVVELLDRDPLLAVPPRVLAFAASAKPPIHLRRRLQRTMAVALRRHVLFDSRRLQGALDDPPNDFESVLDGLRDAADRVTPERMGLEIEALTASQRSKLYGNATISLTLLLALRDAWTVDTVVDVLYRRLWRDGIDAADRLASIGALADARDVAALASMGRVFVRQRRDAERLASQAQDEAERALRRALSADAELAGRDETIRALERRSSELANEIIGLRESLAVEAQSRVHDRSHHVDDYEALRTRIVRVLDKQVELLSDGLHALREGAAEVTEEFVERTIASLSRELAQLRGQGGDG